MASFENRGGGKVRAEVFVSGVREKRTFNNRALAQQWAVKREQELRANGGIQDFHSVADAFMEYAKRVSPKKNGEKFETHRIESFIRDYPALAAKKLRDVSADDFSRWRDERLAGNQSKKIKPVTNATVARELNLYSNIFQVARKEWKWINASPISDVRRPPDTAPRTQRFEDDDIDRILHSLGHVEGDTPDTVQRRIAYAFLFAIETAMRQGEICNLTWEHTHIDQDYVHLPKTKMQRPRDVPLSPRAKDILKIMEILKGQSEGDSVFCLASAQVDSNFRKAKIRAGLRELNFHDTRREALTRMADILDVMELSKVSGHKDINILNNVYYAPKIKNLADKLKRNVA